MPTRPLVTRYEDDLRLFPDAWHKLGLALGAIVLLGFPFAASPSWLTISHHALIAIVGAVGLMILTGLASSAGSSFWHHVLGRVRNLKEVAGQVESLASGEKDNKDKAVG